MVCDGLERKVLERMSRSLVAKKSEILESLRGEVNVSESVINAVIKSLVQKGFLTTVYASDTTLAITQKGMREINE